MIKYLYQILDEFIEEITKTSATPSADYLFRIREKCDSAQLLEGFAVIFHHTVAQLLCVLQRVKRDIQILFSFLTKWVKNPDIDDWDTLV